MIRLLYDTTIGGMRHGAGSIISLGSALELPLITEGDAESIDLNMTHPYYHFHGFAGNQVAGDSNFFDLAAGNHGLRGAHLSDASAFATPGYISTVDPGAGAADSTIHIPSINFDYAGGEKLIVWWLGAGTPEGASVPVMGDGYSTAAGQHGWRVRMLPDGRFDLALWGAAQGSSGSSNTAVFDGTLHSLAFCFDGAARLHGMWADGAYHAAFGSSYSGFGSGTAFDTTSSNTVNIGSSRPASAATTDGAAIKTRALVIIRLPATHIMPSVATLTEVFKQLRANPGRLLQAAAF